MFGEKCKEISIESEEIARPVRSTTNSPSDRVTLLPCIDCLKERKKKKKDGRPSSSFLFF
jgi:hypothetical protein